MDWRKDSRPPVVDAVAKEAYVRSRGIDPLELFDPVELSSWSHKQALEGVREWATEMSEEFWLRGCVVERFLYAYAVYMVAGEGRQIQMEWCFSAINDLLGWLERET